MSKKKIKLTADNGLRLYDVFVCFMHLQYGGPRVQRTPTTDATIRITKHMPDVIGDQLCYELCREYLSNTDYPPTRVYHSKENGQ